MRKRAKAAIDWSQISNAVPQDGYFTGFDTGALFDHEQQDIPANIYWYKNDDLRTTILTDSSNWIVAQFNGPSNELLCFPFTIVLP